MRTENKCDGGLVVVNMADVEKKEVDWLWPGRIPLKMPTILAGDPGVGKSYLTLFMAAAVSGGCAWPDGTQCPEGEVAVFCTEDSLECTVKPRLIMMGAKIDERKIHVIVAVREKDENGNEFQNFFVITKHYLMLERLLKENPRIRLIIIDPLSGYLGTTDTRVEAKVRQALAPLSQMADRYNVAIVCVMHLNKGNSANILYRANGSMAFTGVARAMWFLCKDPNDPSGNRRLLINAKMNVADRPTGLALEIKAGVPVFEKEPVDITPEEVLGSRSNIESPAKDRAIEFLKEALADGIPVASKQLDQMAKEAGIKGDTLKRAKKELAVKSWNHLKR